MINKNRIFFFLLLFVQIIWAQTKVSGVVIDQNQAPVSFANVIFKGSTIGTVSDENGKFYLESEKTYNTIEVSFLGFKTKQVPVKQRDFNLKIVLEESAAVLSEVKLYSGRVKNKDNPAIGILKKVWAKKRKNGLKKFRYYEYDKYEKIEFDLNTIDEKFKKKKIFKGMEFIFDQVDTSSVTGKNYLPIFINESLYKVYGKNTIPKKVNEKLIANKNSGFNENQGLIAFIKQLYVDYDIYNNWITIFDKSFTSPLSRLGPATYNYVLADTAFIDNKWCYNIVFYPRRDNELTFKGDFWVNDTTFAVKEIEMTASKNANINWVKDIYIEQKFEVLNDSIFLLKRDYIMSDFAYSKKEKTKGVYGRKTTIYDNHVFDLKRPDSYYVKDVLETEDIYNKTEDFWAQNRKEQLSKNEKGIYEMLDTLQTIRRFREFISLTDVLTTGYMNVAKGFDWGPIFSTIGYNDIEGLRLRIGGRTFFSRADRIRFKGFLAYGFKDAKFKYGIEGRWLIDRKSRLIYSFGNRRDIEQLGVSLTTTNDILDRSFAATSIFTRGDNEKLTNTNITTTRFTIEPVKNIEVGVGLTFKTLKAADPALFRVDYYDENGIPQPETKQTEITFAAQFTPKRKPWGLGVDRGVSNEGRFPIFYLSYSRGFEGMLESDFNYHKFQFYYEQPIQFGLLGRTNMYFEIGKTINPVPLLLLNVVPGNQTYFTARRVFDLLDYYEFVTDQYASLHLEHNFNGRLFSKIPFLKKLQWRELIGIRSVVGSISQENIAINASSVEYVAPEKLYWEYHVGVGNIFKLIRIDFSWRGSYRDMPNATKFAIKGGLGFYF